MILGIGIDVVEIERFKHWHEWNIDKLQRLLHSDEISYCLQEPAKSAERFAGRYAAKEALYKAFCGAFADKKVPFLTVCKNSRVVGKPPSFIFGKDIEVVLGSNIPIFHLSISHSKTVACAMVIIESNVSRGKIDEL